MKTRFIVKEIFETEDQKERKQRFENLLIAIIKKSEIDQVA